MKRTTEYPDDVFPEEDNRVEEQLTGLLLAGTVVDRTRRYVPKDDPKQMIVTYTIDDGIGHQYYVDEFEPRMCFDIGMFVTVNVYVKPYIRRSTKEAAYSLGIQRFNSTSRGERF